MFTPVLLSLKKQGCLVPTPRPSWSNFLFLKVWSTANTSHKVLPYLQPSTYRHLEASRILYRKEPEKNKENLWRLHHDNASALKAREWLTKNDVFVPDHTAYLPDLTPNEFYLFPKTKSSLQGQRFEDIDRIQSNTDKVPKCLQVEDFQYCINKSDGTNLSLLLGSTVKVTA